MGERVERSLVERYEKASTTEAFPRCICVEGNIGSGKSTLLRKLEENGYFVLQEPVKTEWDKYLPLYYSDCERWGMTFQLEVMQWFHKLKTILLPALCQQHKRIIVERSPSSSFFIFCTHLYEHQLMTDWEYDKVKWIYNNITWKPKKTLYLQVEPETCVERIKTRDRKSESGIENSLIDSLHEKHEVLWANNQDPDVEVIILDATKGIEEVC